MRFRAGVLLVLAGCPVSRPVSAVRTLAANDFDCPPDVVQVEPRDGRVYAKGVQQWLDERLYVARGCRRVAVYCIGGELFSGAGVCADTLAGGKRLRARAFCGYGDSFCLQTMADAGALAP
jgi:hypothetical protein